MLQLERKIAMKRSFLPSYAVVFRFFQAQSIAFTARKLCFYDIKAALLPCNSYAFSG